MSAASKLIELAVAEADSPRGLAAPTVDAVTRRANVDTSVICRWSPSEEALALDALRHEWLALTVGLHHGAAGVRL